MCIRDSYWGSPSLDPYAELRSVPPSEVLGGSVLVYQGRFAFPRALAVFHSARAAEAAEAGSLEEAVREARLAVSLSPESPMTHRSLARALAASDDPAGALAELRRALDLCGEKEPAFRRRLRRSLELEIARLE